MMRSPRRAARKSAAWVRRLIGRHRPRGLILCYHRIADSPADPWNLCVSPANFRGQLDVLRRHADVVPLEALPGVVSGATRGRSAAAITFDDGYVDNLTHAAPALRDAGLPATVFVVTGWTGRDRPFWWDRLAWSLLVPGRLPERLELPLPRGSLTWKGPGGFGSRIRWQGRLALQQRIWSELRHLDEDERDEALARLGRWSGADPSPIQAGRPMTESEVNALAAQHFDIGGHTVSHPSLPELARDQQESEIRRSLDHCEAMTGRRPSSFAYPHGQADDVTIGAAGRAGLAIACSGVEALVTRGSQRLALPRVSVHDWTPAQFAHWLRWIWLP
jgi:peptidoglycan/xylan/chitin deacetylase (PgdA/CDA1 family)